MKKKYLIFKFLLFPFAIIYSIIANLRNFLFDKNIFKSKKFDQIKVITIGNLSVGGTGKTPHTEKVVSLLKNNNKIAVLSRGYKRKTKGFLYVNPNDNYLNTGDEPLQISQKFEDITVAVCENRRFGIDKIIKDNNVKYIILDDGFQHRRVKPNISILLTEYNSPFFKDFFLPVGFLRDNRKEYKRADIIIVTKCSDNIKKEDIDSFTKKLNPKFNQKIFFSKIIYSELENLYNKNLKKEINRNTTILLLSGIAKTQYLYNYIKKHYSSDIINIEYSDHKNFTKQDIEKIISTYEKITNKNKIIITTEKDSIRLKKTDINSEIQNIIFVQKIKIEFLFDTEKDFLQQISNFWTNNYF